MKLHYDHGLSEIAGKKVNFYGSVNMNKSLNNFIFKAGVSENSTIKKDARLKIEKSKSGLDYTLYTRVSGNKDKFGFGILSAMEIGKNILSKRNLFFSYAHDSQNKAFLRL